MYCNVFYRYNLHELHIFFSLLDTVLCTVVPSVLVSQPNTSNNYENKYFHQLLADNGREQSEHLPVPAVHEGLLVGTVTRSISESAGNGSGCEPFSNDQKDYLRFHYTFY